MRLKNYTILLMAVLTLGFAACKKAGTADGGGTGGEEGGTGKLTLKIKQAKGLATYTDDDANSTDAEATINSVDVFIFDNGAPYGLVHRAITDPTLIYNTPGDVNDGLKALTLTGVKTGTKRIYIGINLTTTVVNKLIENYSYMQDGISFNAGAITDKLFAHLVTATNGTANDGRIAMFNTYDYDDATVGNRNIYTITDGGANTFTINVSRLVAKVAVKVAPTLDLHVPGGTLSVLQFTAGQTNNRLQLAPLRGFRDLNWASFQGTDFNLNAVDAGFQAYSHGAINLANDDWTDFDFGLATTPKVYIPENTSQTHHHNEVSFISLKATFTPTDDGEPAGFGSTPTVQGAFPSGTFYAVFSNDVGSNGAPVPGMAVHFFPVQGDAAAYALAHSGEILTYTGGFCYYRIYLNPNANGGATGNAYDVLRNVFYKVNITRINTIGTVSPDNIPGALGTPGFPSSSLLTDYPEVLPAHVINPPVNADINTTITITNWSDQQGDYEF
jgi:hypothetical protein